MKKIALTLLIAAFALSVSAQKLLDAYKKGTIRLVPDTEYAVGNDWNKVFSTYNDTLYNKFMGDRKSLKIMPDGSVVVSHAYRDFYTKFSPKGVFEKEFGIKNSKGVPMKKIKAISGIINNNTFYTGLDNMGNMICFDFTGKYVKTLKLDYMTREMIPLPNRKIAVVGWVIWAKKTRDFVAIVDYATNEEKIIWDAFTNRDEKYYYVWPASAKSPATMVQVSGPGGAPVSASTSGTASAPTSAPTLKSISLPTPSSSSASAPASTGGAALVISTKMSIPPKIACVGNKLIVAFQDTGEILEYDLEGNLKSKGKVGWPVQYISVEDQKKKLQNSIDRYKNNDRELMASGVSVEIEKNTRESIIKQLEAEMAGITEPKPISPFSTIIQDSDGNLLFFEYPKEENANKFHVWVYENTGKFVCESSFVCDEYKLEISPSKMVFHNGYIYGLQLLKNAQGVPLRLVRFKITNE